MHRVTSKSDHTPPACVVSAVAVSPRSRSGLWIFNTKQLGQFMVFNLLVNFDTNVSVYSVRDGVYHVRFTGDINSRRGFPALYCSDFKMAAFRLGACVWIPSSTGSNVGFRPTRRLFPLSSPPPSPASSLPSYRGSTFSIALLTSELLSSHGLVHLVHFTFIQWSACFRSG